MTLRGAMERQSGEIRVIGSDLRSRPTLDPAVGLKKGQISFIQLNNNFSELQVQHKQLKVG
jgi:hypothetical protein